MIIIIIIITLLSLSPSSLISLRLTLGPAIQVTCFGLKDLDLITGKYNPCFYHQNFIHFSYV
jgi:hypothetical protein